MTGMTFQHRACSLCLAETLLGEQAAWQAVTACPASPWDFSVGSLGTAPLPGSSLSALHMGPAHTMALFSLPRFGAAVLPFPQGALGDSFPREGFTSENGTGLKETREDPLLSLLVKQLQSSKGCHRPCQKRHE